VSVDKCVCAFRAVEAPLFCQNRSCSKEASVAGIEVGGRQFFSEILDELCCFP